MWFSWFAYAKRYNTLHRTDLQLHWTFLRCINKARNLHKFLNEKGEDE